MAAPKQIAEEFENWLNERLDSLEVDREVYGAYILGVLQEEENDEEQKDALQGILSAFLVSARAWHLHAQLSCQDLSHECRPSAVVNIVNFKYCYDKPIINPKYARVLYIFFIGLFEQLKCESWSNACCHSPVLSSKNNRT